MTAPVWMASPPEVHSTLLNSGPGPGSLLAAATAWNSLSVEYADAAAELGDVLAAVQAGAWQGPSAERYLAAHVPYLAWLTQAGADSAAEAAQLQTAAAAYATAVAAMPTMAELAANHVIHGVLLATNFFGINTIPIAVNEADYARMWVQAAITMTSYHAVSENALAAAPRTQPAPQIVNSPSAHAAASDPGNNSTLDIIDNDSGNPYTLSWYINRITEVTQTLQRDIGLIGQNPAQGLTQLFADVGGLASDEFGHAIEFVQAFPEVLAVPFIVPAVAVAGLGGLGGLAAIQPQAAPLAVDTPAPTTQAVPPAASGSPVAVGAPGTAPTSAPASAPVSSVTSVANAAPASPSAPAGPGFVPPYAVGPPGIGTGAGMTSRTGAGASDKKKAAEPYAAAAPVAAAAREQRQSRRRRRVGVRRYSDEYMEMNVNVEPDFGARSAKASDRGAGSLGFAGTVQNSAAQAAGLATLENDDFGGGPRMPMLPGTWNIDDDLEAAEGGERR